MDYSIIIVAYKSESVIGDCINAILESALKLNISIEIIIVDNDAQGYWGTIDLIESMFSDARILTIKSLSNGGFSYGCNAGASCSTGRWLLFLNPDAFVAKNFFKLLSRDLVELGSKFDNDYPLILGFKMLATNGLPNRNGGYLPELFVFKTKAKKNIFDSGFLLKVDDHKTDGLIWPLGAAMLVSRVVFNDVGGFEEKLFLTLEEPTFLRSINKYVLFISNASVVHDGGHSYENSLDECKFFYSSLLVYRRIFNFSLLKSFKLFVTSLRLRIKIFILSEWNGNGS